MQKQKYVLTLKHKAMKCRIKVGEICSDVIDFEQAAKDVKYFISVFGAKSVSIIFE